MPKDECSHEEMLVQNDEAVVCHRLEEKIGVQEPYRVFDRASSAREAFVSSLLLMREFRKGSSSEPKAVDDTEYLLYDQPTCSVESS